VSTKPGAGQIDAIDEAQGLRSGKKKNQGDFVACKSLHRHGSSKKQRNFFALEISSGLISLMIERQDRL
jgi:hypothetical protein